jgi:hypothetical protein
MERFCVFRPDDEEETHSNIFGEESSNKPGGQEKIDLIKQLTTLLLARHFQKSAVEIQLTELQGMGIGADIIQCYLLCNFTLRETLDINNHTRGEWILALERMKLSQKQIADAIQLGQHFKFRCKKDRTLDPYALVTQAVLEQTLPQGTPFPAPTI